MRSDDEIYARLLQFRDEKQKYDPLGFRFHLLLYLASPEVVSKLGGKKCVVEEGMDDTFLQIAEQMIINEVHSRIQREVIFLCEDIVENRAAAAFRSVTHLEVYFWFVCDDYMVEFIKCADNYGVNGMPIIEEIRNRYGYSVPDWYQVR